MLPLLHWFQNCFCFCCTTFPSHVGTFCQQLQVLHCDYNNGDLAPKFDLFITFDWGVVLTQGQLTCLNSILQDLFRNTPLDHYKNDHTRTLSTPNTPNIAKYTKYCIWHTYLGKPSMVEWSITEKIMQNAAQKH